MNFNSIKVQLELINLERVMSNFQLFQFHKGTIRTVGARKTHYLVGDFNSIKVQLEPYGRPSVNEEKGISIP